MSMEPVPPCSLPVGWVQHPVPHKLLSVGMAHSMHFCPQTRQMQMRLHTDTDTDADAGTDTAPTCAHNTTHTHKASPDSSHLGLARQVGHLRGHPLQSRGHLLQRVWLLRLNCNWPVAGCAETVDAAAAAGLRDLSLLRLHARHSESCSLSDKLLLLGLVCQMHIVSCSGITGAGMACS